ncbi:neurofilament heavy polypeptide-like isoform X2 [Anopheles bellator]|uniref:neurofilament heavy polypeptide-like isoform X2 n=1 Tax=Anopheles bellator TaxID=139047 RepID=UPI00264827A1|nr:neurofilament heavy polypeptide-like isoform X2 [Anopheles bellator]
MCMAEKLRSNENDSIYKRVTKRTPKRKAEAFQKESEALLKNLGVTVDLDDGRRRTRSSSRAVTATPPTTPATPPAKRARGAATQPKSPSQALDETQKSKATPKKREHVVEPRKIVLEKDQPIEESQPEANTSSAPAAENSVEKMDVSTVQQQAKSGKPEGQVGATASDVAEERKADDTKVREVDTKDEADATSKTTEAPSAEVKKDEEHQKDAKPQKKNDEPPAADGVKESVVSAAEEPMEVDGGSGEKAVSTSEATANVTAGPVRVESTDSSATEENHENSTDSVKQEERPKDSNTTTDGVTKEEVKVVETKVVTATNVVESNGEVMSHPEDTVLKTAKEDVNSTMAEVVDGPEKKAEEQSAPVVGKEPPAENTKAVSVPTVAPLDVTSSTVVEIDDNSSNEDTVPIVKSVDVDCAPKENSVADKVNSNVEPKIVANEPTAVEAAPAAP